jgi:hypothetical protein
MKLLWELDILPWIRTGCASKKHGEWTGIRSPSKVELHGFEEQRGEGQDTVRQGVENQGTRHGNVESACHSKTPGSNISWLRILEVACVAQQFVRSSRPQGLRHIASMCMSNEEVKSRNCSDAILRV